MLASPVVDDALNQGGLQTRPYKNMPECVFSPLSNLIGEGPGVRSQYSIELHHYAPNRSRVLA